MYNRNTNCIGQIGSHDFEYVEGFGQISKRTENNSLLVGTSTPGEFLSRQETGAFSLFTKLPAELRVIIWAMSLPGYRVIEIRPSTEGYYSAATIPSLLQTCRESRHEALKIYSLSLRGSGTLSQTYFDFSTDVLYLNSRFFPTFSEMYYFLNETEGLGYIRSLLACCCTARLLGSIGQGGCRTLGCLETLFLTKRSHGKCWNCPEMRLVVAQGPWNKQESLDVEEWTGKVGIPNACMVLAGIEYWEEEYEELF